MDRRRKVELFEQIRREYRFGVGTIRACAKPSWIASPTGRTSSRPEPSLIVSAERWRYGRKRKSRSFQSFYRAKPRKGLRTPSLPRRSIPAELGSHWRFGYQHAGGKGFL